MSGYYYNRSSSGDLQIVGTITSILGTTPSVSQSGTWTTVIGNTPTVNAAQSGTWTTLIGNTPSVTGTVTAILGLWYANRSDTYTAAANGTTVDASTFPVRSLSIQLAGSTAVASGWDVRLEGSLNNSNFVEVMRHVTSTGDGAFLGTGATLGPLLYFRSRCVSLTLGSASNIVVNISGTSR